MIGLLHTRRDRLEHIRPDRAAKSAGRCISLIFEGMVNREMEAPQKTKPIGPFQRVGKCMATRSVTQGIELAAQKIERLPVNAMEKNIIGRD